MEKVEQTQVLERLRELEGWAEYITEALHRNVPGEPVKREMLEQLIGMEALRQIREMSWSLRDRFHLIATEMELSGGESAVSRHILHSSGVR